MADGYARTFDEAHLFMELRPCDCGEAELDARSTPSRDGDGWLQEYHGFCPNCGRERRFVFEMPDGVSSSPTGVRYGPDDQPSRLLDPAEWLAVSDALSDNARLLLAGASLTEEQVTTAYMLLASALAATEEVLKFVPADGDGVPSSAFWTQIGMELFAGAGDRFRADRLASDIAERRRALTDFEARLKEGRVGDA